MRRETRRVYDRIVMNDDKPIIRGMDIQLDGVGAELDGAQECRDGVFRDGLVRSPVGDSFGRGSPVRRVHAFSRVLALGTVTAKL